MYYDVWPRNVHALTTWNTTSVQIHSRKRRILSYAFSDQALRSAELFVTANTDRWCEVIADEAAETTGWTKSLNMADWANYLIFDILGDLCFGKGFNMKEHESDLKYVPHLMVEFMTLMHPVGFSSLISSSSNNLGRPQADNMKIAYSPFASLWAWLKPRGLDKLISLVPPPALLNWGSFVEKCLAERTKVEEFQGEKGGRKDFFHYLYHAIDPETGERGYDLDELYGECEMLIIAGADTTATVTAAMLFYLARRPELQAKLAREVLAAFSSSGEIKAGAALQSCRYLRAFIQETLRMAPPVPAEPAREVLAGGTTVDGMFFPAGVQVSVGIYCLNYSDDIFPEPFEFRPERWIVGESSQESVALAESGFCTFSYGSRGCVGKNLAWLEMSVVMAKLIYNFEVRPDASNHIGGGSLDGRFGRRAVDQYQILDAFVAMRDGPVVQFKKRDTMV